jgi:diguanylate cyclase (GGDEF)-like protein
LTGLANRANFESFLLDAIEKAQEVEEKLAVIFLDLDKFKSINDTLGHDIGDKLLLSVSSRIKNSLPLLDIAARQGGDEFTIILKNTTKESAEHYVKELLESLKLPHNIGRHQLISTPSIGIALYPDHGTTSVELMKNADTAMYQVKENGKGSYLFYSEAAKVFTKKLLLEKDMPKALEKNEFFLHYQPLMDLSAGKITGTEALLRWNHPELGILLPGEFIPIAEETGYIHKLGEWVLREACNQAKRWNDNGFVIKMGVNLSPRQFYQENLSTIVEQALANSGLDPAALDLEITEETAITNLQTVIPKLHALKALGVTISIDDFGTGYSSLSYLADLPVDTVKIAREFISNMEENKSKETIISSIVNMAKNLNLDVLAEGVEEVNQALLLKSINCHSMQGFLFGRPCDKGEMEDLLKKQPYISL